MSSISTQNNSELDGQNNITYPGDQFPKANERKKGSNDNCLETAIPLICVAPTMKTKYWRKETIHTSKVILGSNKEGKRELGSYIATCVAGATQEVMEYTGVVCDIYPHSNSCKPLTQSTFG